MNFKKTMLPVGIVTGVTLISLSGAGLVSASTPNSDQSSLVDKIAQRFNLNKSDVQKVFDENHAAHEAQREEHQKSRLDQAVQDGKITSEQEAKILAKLKEMKADRQANHDEFEGLTPDQRHAEMQSKRTELEKWAKDNNIPIEYLMHFGHGGPGGPGRHGDMD